MKFRFLYLCLVVYCVPSLGISVGNPLLVVVLMVKNEASAMQVTLQPFADAGINSYLILDTGSTDETIVITQKFFEDNGITQGFIVEQPFVDFATSRNHALRCAQEKFPQAGFLLMIDAEWCLRNVAGLIKFCTECAMDTHDSYLIRISAWYGDFYTQRLIRPRRGVRFVGVVHETLDRVSYDSVPADIFFELCTTRYGCEKSARRWERDKDLLLKEFERNPHDLRTTFYLAQTYACLGDLENAHIFYTKRCALRGWDEEDFMARYRLGQVCEWQGNWPQALSAYLEAFAFRPTRAEPLISIACYYLKQGNHQLSYLFARRATEIAYPASDVLFVEREAYEFARHDILGQCAWYVGAYEVGEDAVRQAIAARPDAPHLYSNLVYYVHRSLF